MQDEDGQILEPYSVSAGLDYPGIGPLHANLATQHRATVLAINDDEAIRAAYELTRLEGIIPALHHPRTGIGTRIGRTGEGQFPPRRHRGAHRIGTRGQGHGNVFE